MRVLSLLQRVLPDRPSLSLVPWRQRAVDLARALIAAVVRRLTRLLAGAPEPPARQRRRPAGGVLALTGTAVTVPEPPPRLDVGSFLSRVRKTRDGRERAAALKQTLADLEQVVGLLRRMNRPSAEVEGLERSYLQIQRLADPDAERTGGELNMAWLLLERELRAVADRL